MERARQHLLEYVLVTAFLVIAAAGTVALFGEELRAVLTGGSAPPAPSSKLDGAPPRQQVTGGSAPPAPADAPPTREGPRG